MTTLILRTALRLIVPLSLAFAVFVYFKGHQTPGGGFVAGLVGSVALIVHRMAFGHESLRRMLPLPEYGLIGIGLSLALCTGLAPVILGLPFLTSDHGYVSLPQTAGGGYTFEWASVMIFDLGVFMVVTGVVVGMIDVLSRELE